MSFVFAILTTVFAVIILGAVALAYDWLRHKINKPRIGGLEYFLRKLIKRDDFISINGKVLRFSHTTQCGEKINPIAPPSHRNITLGGDLAFDNPNSLGYLIYPLSALRNCEFVYGKYGLKWAISHEWATMAKEKVNEYIWN